MATIGLVYNRVFKIVPSNPNFISKMSHGQHHTWKLSVFYNFALKRQVIKIQYYIWAQNAKLSHSYMHFYYAPLPRLSLSPHPSPKTMMLHQCHYWSSYILSCLGYCKRIQARQALYVTVPKSTKIPFFSKKIVIFSSFFVSPELSSVIVSPELSSVRDYVITHSVHSMYVVCT